MAATIRRFVECESPSDDAAAVNRFVELVADTVAPFAKVKTYPGGKFGRLMVAEMQLPGRRKSGQVLALGHSDTVWPIGTLRTHAVPRRRTAGLWGPGVLDMKAGIVFFLFAVRALRELDIAAGSKVLLQLNPDEEVGSDASRALTEKNAARSKAVLVLEPGTGLTGKLKTARKGVGDFHVAVKGRASHAGVDFEAGASAMLELARQIDTIAGFTELRRGITVNPGVIARRHAEQCGGGRGAGGCGYTGAAVAGCAGAGEEVPGAAGRSTGAARIEVTGGLNRPPMERSAGIVALFRKAQKLGREIGVELEESLTGGGSDGNFTAALGVPTLDGLGAVGEGAHAANESLLVDRMADRTALLGKLLAEL